MLRLELAELDALVELAVVDGDGALGAAALVARLAWKLFQSIKCIKMQGKTLKRF